MTEDKIKAVAAALRRAAELKPRPCVVTNMELLGLADGTRLSLGTLSRIGRSTPMRYDLYRALGGRAWGSAPTYTRGVWAL